MCNKYEVTVRAVITKTYIIDLEENDSYEAAVEKAHEVFSVLPDNMPERYEQELLDICKLTPDRPYQD